MFGLIIGGIIALFRLWFLTANDQTVSYSEVIKPTLPFSVSIIVQQSSDPADLNGLSNDPVVSKFLTPNLQSQTSLGSGILINKDGWVATNAHVIQNTANIIVKMADNKLVEVNRVLIDPESDIAVLKTDLISSMAPPIAPIVNEQVGDIVFSIGNPFGIGQSVSMGIISAQRRIQPGLKALNDFIQTDAAINPGNSGGPLVNFKGQIIGMNTAIYSSSGGSQGIGFAIPFDFVMEIANQLINQGEIQRGFLGIDAEPALVSNAGNLPSVQGLKVLSVQTNSPAEKAGIKQNDVIINLAGTQIPNRAEAARLISRLMPGKKLEITLIRDGRQLVMEVILTSRSDKN